MIYRIRKSIEKIPRVLPKPKYTNAVMVKFDLGQQFSIESLIPLYQESSLQKPEEQVNKIVEVLK